jgi:TolA-binding protein
MSASASPSAGALQLRLSEQMQALSLVSETLTLRLLELEERLGALEGQLEGLQHLQSNTLSNDSADMLTATEERIARLEDLLTEQSAPQRATVHPLQRPTPKANAQDADFNEPELELNPFPEEDEEQPFMDELSA